MSCDPLEPRRLFANTLTLNGSADPDAWTIRLHDSTHLYIWQNADPGTDPPTQTVTLGTGTGQFGSSDSIVINGYAGDDSLTLDTNGSPASATPAIHFTAGDGANDTLQLVASSSGTSDLLFGDDGTTGHTLVMAFGWATAHTDAERLAVQANGSAATIEAYDPVGGRLEAVDDLGTGSTVILDGVPLQFDASQHLAALVPGPTSVLAGAGAFVRAPAPSLSGDTSLDLNDDALILDYTCTPSPVSTLRSALLAGRNSGSWDGATGGSIYSTTAHDDPDHLHAVGYAEAADLLGLSGTATATWQGETVDPTTLLARGTWLGDANLDGTVDDADFDLVRRSIEHYATLDPADRPAYATWSTGDFNYDGKIDDADLALMTDAFNAVQNAHFDALTGTSHNRTVVGTGVASNDVPSFYAALDVLTANGGGTLTIDGTLDLSSAGLLLDGVSNIRIRGTHFDPSTHAPLDGLAFSTDAPSGDENALLMLNTCSDVLIQGLDLDGGGYVTNGVSVVNSDHVTVDGNTFHDASDGRVLPLRAGILAYGNLDDHYTNNYFQSLDETGIHAGHTADRPAYTRGSQIEDNPVIIRNTMYHLTSGDGVIGHMPHALISGNTVDTVPGTGIGFSSTGPQANNNANDVISCHVVVFYNSITGAGGQGVQSDVYLDVYTENCTVMKNTISNCNNSGIFMKSVKGWTVTGNTITDCALNGILVVRGGSYTTITYNQVSGCGTTLDNGIHDGGIFVRIYDGDEVVNPVIGLHITNNTVTGNTGCGIYLSEFTYTDDQQVEHWGTGYDFLITGNTCTGTILTESFSADLYVYNAGHHLTLTSDDITPNTTDTNNINI